MTEHSGQQPDKKRQGSRGVENRWVRLPASVVEARAGLIPSEETDANPPPEGLTVKQLLRWHKGLPVLSKTK
jgi:hypothetical protein